MINPDLKFSFFHNNLSIVALVQSNGIAKARKDAGSNPARVAISFYL